MKSTNKEILSKENKIFDHFQNWEPTLWQKIKLLFAKSYRTADFGYGKDKGVILTFKKLGESIFLIKNKHL